MNLEMHTITIPLSHKSFNTQAGIYDRLEGHIHSFFNASEGSEGYYEPWQQKAAETILPAFRVN